MGKWRSCTVRSDLATPCAGENCIMDSTVDLKHFFTPKFVCKGPLLKTGKAAAALQTFVLLREREKKKDNLMLPLATHSSRYYLLYQEIIYIPRYFVTSASARVQNISED